MILLEESILDSVWQRYVAGNATSEYQRHYATKHYRQSARRAPLSQAFENWLFTHGAVVRRVNKHCYLEFSFEEQATLFALKML